MNGYLIVCWKLCKNHYYLMIIIITFLVEFLWVKLLFAIVQCFSNVHMHKNLLGSLFIAQIPGPYPETSVGMKWSPRI